METNNQNLITTRWFTTKIISYSMRGGSDVIAAFVGDHTMSAAASSPVMVAKLISDATYYIYKDSLKIREISITIIDEEGLTHPLNVP